MNNHTPGPWQWDGPTCPLADDYKGPQLFKKDALPDRIASAPDLYDAAAELLKYRPREGSAAYHAAWLNLRNACKKATGP